MKVAVLFSKEEMELLFTEFPNLILLNTSSVCEKNETEISKELFLETYATYIERAKKNQEYLSPFLTVGMTVDQSAYFAMDVGQGRVLLRQKRPLIQVRPFHYSIQEGKVFEMSFHKDKIFWGVEFSYPQLFSASRDAKIERIWRNQEYPNSMVFVSLLKWIYAKSLLYPPARVGKQYHEQFLLEKTEG
ncbi:MAG: hypothetical protein FJZ56_01310 [Chlamydiae bacterium]|nr:hypothetical protein [Chlamydiota bacterium]